MNTNDPRFELIRRCRDGEGTAEEFAQLESCLRDDADFRQAYVRYFNLDVALSAVAKAVPMPVTTMTPARPRRNVWLNWRPLTAAAAGIVFGMFCTSMVFAYVAPLLAKPLTLLDTSFENVARPQPAGVPVKTGEWGGDYAELVGSQNGVTPHSGAKMWRFLRADNAVDPAAPANYVGEAFHVIDLKPLRAAGVKAGSQIEISAWFAEGQTAADSRYHWNIKAAAFEGEVADARKLWGKWSDASASLAGREVAAETGGRWQRLSVAVQLPANADFLVFECAVVQRKPEVTQGVAEFPAHYVDDVRVRLLPPTREANVVN